MNRKKLITILATITIIATLSVSLFFAQLDVSATTYNTGNMTVEGVLASDNYVLFPFANKSLKIGFSKYGEMIDGITDTGLAYDGYDAFAPPDGVVKWQWVEGWIINITYVQGGYYKNVWAMATYSDYYDSAGIGGPWHENVTCGSLGLAVRGGRKTSGGAETDPIKVLYDGPRRFVALLNTTIYAEPAHTTPLVRITFTIIFNKVKKQVIILKDVKRIDIGKNIWDMQIEFGDRGEWDLGASTAGAAPKSYAHIFENQSTVYNGHYQSWYNTTYGNYNGTYDICQIIDDDLNYVGWAAFWPKPIVTWVGSTQLDADRPFILTSTSTKTEVHELATGDDLENFTLIETPANYPQKNGTGIFWIEDPMVFHNDHIKVVNGTTTSEMVWYFRGNNTVKFPAGYWPAVGDTVKIVYKYLRPHADMSSEPASPFVVGEWAFRMYESSDMFRGVTVYGITDLNDGSDANEVLDTEVQYYLNETFNPYDLYDAVHKQTKRWVDKRDLTTATSSITLTDGLGASYGPTLGPWPVTLLAAQSPTNASAEYSYERNYTPDKHWSAKLWVNNTDAGQDGAYAAIKIDINQELTVADAGHFDFWYYVPSTGNAPYPPHVCFYTINATHETAEISGPEPSTPPMWPVTAGWHHVSVNASTPNFFWYGNSTDITQGEGTENLVTWGNFTEQIPEYEIRYIQIEFGWWNPASGLVGTVYIDDIGLDDIYTTNLENGKLIPTDWDAYCSFAERVLADGVLLERGVDYTIDFVTATITFTPALAAGTHLKVLYSTVAYENNAPKGRYEWMIVGKNAATVDSIGAAYITEAFDSIKDIHVLLTGLDINDTAFGQHVPFVMGGAVTGTKADYRDTLGRTFLRDDWCTTYPVSSSNMLFSGGPIANLGTEYFNEFTNAFFARGEYVTNDTGHAQKILALTCWNRYAYGAGYAVISVYKDLNGTIGFLIWGYNGEDTYYATKWFWEEGIEYLQGENRGVTDIILEIDYTTCPYSVDLAIPPDGTGYERLGTISEKAQHDP